MSYPQFDPKIIIKSIDNTVTACYDVGRSKAITRNKTTKLHDTLVSSTV